MKIKQYVQQAVARLLNVAAYDEEDYPEAAEVAERVSKLSKVKVNAIDYIKWMEDYSPKFESAVGKILSDDDQEFFEGLARLPEHLMYVLGMGDAKAGGVDVSKDSKGKKVKVLRN